MSRMCSQADADAKVNAIFTDPQRGGLVRKNGYRCVYVEVMDANPVEMKLKAKNRAGGDVFFDLAFNAPELWPECPSTLFPIGGRPSKGDSGVLYIEFDFAQLRDLLNHEENGVAVPKWPRGG